MYRGTSINATAALRDTSAARGFPGTLPRVVGFDTFEGIPQEWKTSKRQARPKWKQDAFSWREDSGTPTPPYVHSADVQSFIKQFTCFCVSKYGRRQVHWMSCQKRKSQ